MLRSPDAIDGAERLTIRTRETPDTLKLQVKAVEQADDTKGVEVKTADTLLKIAFAPTAVTYDDANSGRVVSFVKSKARPAPNMKSGRSRPRPDRFPKPSASRSTARR